MIDTYKEDIYKVRSYECTSSGAIHFPQLCNYLQEIASNHADELGFSKKDFVGENLTWVMTRLRVKITRYPTWNEPLKILTFPWGGKKLFAYRDFVIYGGDGQEIGVASTEWMTLNLAERKAVPIPPAVLAASNTVRQPVFGVAPFDRFNYPTEVDSEVTNEFPVRFSQIDLNAHVNNVRYIEWMLDSSPEILNGKQVQELELVFRTEAMLGDVVTAKSVLTQENERYHKIISAQGVVHTLARSRWV